MGSRFDIPCHAYRVRRAYSLMELLVAIGIFIVITGFLLANFRRARQSDVVRTAASVFAAYVQRMQAMALAGGSPTGSAIAFGIHATASADDRYALFGDRASATRGAYDRGEELANGIILLPPDVQIAAVAPDGVADIVFAIPRAAVTFTGGNVSGTMRVTFAHRTSGDRQSVVINRISGQVSVE